MKTKTKDVLTNYGSWAFLILCILIYVGVIIFDTELGVKFIKSFLSIAWELFPIFILIIVFVFFFNLFLDKKKMMKFLGRKSGVKGWAFAIIGGILSSGPGYMWYPMLEDLRKRGMRTSLAVGFLYNRGVQIPLLPMMIHYFGSWFTLFFTFYMIVFSIINGLLVERLVDHRHHAHTHTKKS